MGMVETEDPQLTLVNSLSKLNELACNLYELCDELKFVFISVLMQYIFTKYVSDKCTTDEKI